MPSSEGPFTDITHPEMLPASSGLAQASLDFYGARLQASDCRLYRVVGY